MGQGVLLLSLSSAARKIIGEFVAKALGLSFFNIDREIIFYLARADNLLNHNVKTYDQAEKFIINKILKEKQGVYVCSYDLYSRNKTLFGALDKFYIYLSSKQLENFNDDDYLINKLALIDRNKILQNECEVINVPEFDKEKISDIIIKKIRMKQ